MENPHARPERPSSAVLRRAAARAMNSLLRWARSHAKKHNKQLSSPIHLILTMGHTTANSKRQLIPLPHPLHPITSTSICLIFDDRPKSILTLPTVKDTIFSKSIPVSKVVAFSSFTSELKSQTARRDLFKSHDVFFVDNRVIQTLHDLIGARHLKKIRNQLLPIDLAVKSRWKEKIESTCGSVAMRLRRTSTCCDVPVAMVSMGTDEILDNVIAVIENVPGRWDNVRSIYVKTDESISLPVYRATEGFGEALVRCGDDGLGEEVGKEKKRENDGRGVEEDNEVGLKEEARKKKKV